MTEIISVSLTREQKDFLNIRNLSPSKLLQTKIQEIQQDANPKELKRKLEAWMSIATKLKDFIKKRGLIDEYLKEDDK